ncbi:MAG: threonine/serine dehydratase [Acidimicrobiales bacterium]
MSAPADRTPVVPAAMIEEAAERVAGRVRRTPVIDWSVRVQDRRVNVTLKLELLQHVGSFKPRGAFNQILSAAEAPRLVVAASGGNHGLAVAYAARELGIRAAVYVPETAPQVKVDGIRALGAETMLVGSSYADAAEASYGRASEPGALYVHPYDQIEVVAGQGTVGLELDSQAPGLASVLVATGGGGLIGGVAAWYGRRTQIVSVEPHGSPTMYTALVSGEPVDVEVGGLASDSLGARRVGVLGFLSARAADVRAVLVSEAAIVQARQLLWDDLRLAAEPGGATALAGLLEGAYRPAASERVGIIVCGANTDPCDLVAR